MTLVAVAESNKWPVLFGDLLISRTDRPPNSGIHLPTQDLTSLDEEETGPFISGLTQKLCVVTENLAVGWSGTKIYARTVIQDMMELFKPGYPVTLRDVEKFFESIDYPEAKEVRMVGMVLAHDKLGRFGRKAEKTTSPLFDEIRFAGSGSRHFLHMLKNFDISTLAETGEPPDLLRTIGKTLLLSSYLIGDEIDTGSNLSSFYGGGFEIVSINNGKFEKFGNITYLFWGVELLSPNELNLWVHPLAIKFSYNNDILLIRRTEFVRQELKDLSTSKHDAVFIVDPIHRSIDKSEIEEIKRAELPDLNSAILCHYFSVKFPGAKPRILVVMDKGQVEMVKFMKQDKKVILAFHKNFTDRLFGLVRQYYT